MSELDEDLIIINDNDDDPPPVAAVAEAVAPHVKSENKRISITSSLQTSLTLSPNKRKKAPVVAASPRKSKSTNNNNDEENSSDVNDSNKQQTHSESSRNSNSNDEEMYASKKPNASKSGPVKVITNTKKNAKNKEQENTEHVMHVDDQKFSQDASEYATGCQLHIP